MENKIYLPPEYPFRLDGTEYTIKGVLGSGGSSIVYTAMSDSGPVVIKELLPDTDINGRKLKDRVFRKDYDNNDMTLIFPPDCEETMAIYGERAEFEFKLLRQIRTKSENNSARSEFMEHKRPVNENNTLYTVIGSADGETLEEIMSSKNKNSNFVGFLDVCEQVLRVLEALKPMHEHPDGAYLHLDISPDNIFVLRREVDGKRVTNLIDFNSVYKTESIETKNRLFSRKEPYSSPELTAIRGTSDPAAKGLTVSTDLYSVAVIFFELLIGRSPTPLDHSVWSHGKILQELSSESGYLLGASNLLVKKTNELLMKGLSIIPSCRFSSVSDMQNALLELKELQIKAEVVNNRKRPYSHFVGRKSELAKIDEFLNNDTYVFLEGMGGIGKSELAKRYAWEYRDKYDVIQFINFEECLMETIALSLKLHNFDAAKYEQNYSQEEVLQRIFDDKMTRLQQCDEKTLIIVDNYNVEADDEFHRFIDGEYRVIFTSREKHDENVIEISSMENDEDLMSLFCEYYKPLTLNETEKATIRDIITLVLGHTMTVMLIASAMKEHDISPTEMFERLKYSLDAELHKAIAVNKEEISVKTRYQVMYQHILNLFNMERFSDDQEANEKYSYIMTNMAIVPYSGLSINLFNDWALRVLGNNEEFVDLMKLVKLRWVQFDEDELLVSLHPVISDVANSTLNPDSVKCAELINAYMRFDETATNMTYVEQMKFTVNLMELACKRIQDKTTLTAMLLAKYANYNTMFFRSDVAIDCQNRLITILEHLRSNAIDVKELSFAEYGLCETYSNLGGNYDSLRFYDDALRCLNESIKIGEHLLQRGELHHEGSLALAYNNRGVTLEKIKKHEESLSDKNKSIEIHERLFKEGVWDDENENSLAKAYMNRSVTYESMQMHDESYADNEKCISIWTKMKAEGRAVDENDLARALLNKSITEAKSYVSKNKSELDMRGQDNLIRGVMAFNKKNKK